MCIAKMFSTLIRMPSCVIPRSRGRKIAFKILPDPPETDPCLTESRNETLGHMSIDDRLRTVRDGVYTAEDFVETDLFRARVLSEYSIMQGAVFQRTLHAFIVDSQFLVNDSRPRPLEGLTCTVKDQLHHVGDLMPPYEASGMLLGTADADTQTLASNTELVKRLSSLGVIPVGTTVAPKHGHRTHTSDFHTNISGRRRTGESSLNDFTGQFVSKPDDNVRQTGLADGLPLSREHRRFTHNPYNPEYRVGGSSAGSAAAVAVGVGACSVGNGDIHISASNCGVLGIRPARGLKFFSEHIPEGLFTRSAEDVGYLFDAIVHPDDVGLSASISSRLIVPTWKPRVAVCAHGGYPELVNKDKQTQVCDVAEELKMKGYEVTELDTIPGLRAKDNNQRSELLEAMSVLWCDNARMQFQEASRDFVSSEAARTLIDPYYYQQMIEPGLKRERDDPESITCAVQGTKQMSERVLEFFRNGVDLFVSPTLTVLPWETNRPTPKEHTGLGLNPIAWMFDVTGQASASIPRGFIDELPSGVHITVSPFRGGQAISAYEQLANLIEMAYVLRPLIPTYPSYPELRYSIGMKVGVAKLRTCISP